MTTTRVLAALADSGAVTLSPPFVSTRRRRHPNAAADSAFLLTTDDPARSPSPFIGNGRVGVVIPPLGIGAAPSLAGGTYEHGPGDVPRIAAMPDWTGIRVFDGDALARRGAASPRLDSELRSIDRHADRHGPHRLRLGGRLPAHAGGGRDLPLACRAGRRGHPARACAQSTGALARPVRARGTCATSPAPARHPPAHRAELGTRGAVVSRAHGRSLAPRGLDARAGLPGADRDAGGSQDRPRPGGIGELGPRHSRGGRPRPRGRRYCDGRDQSSMPPRASITPSPSSSASRRPRRANRLRSRPAGWSQARSRGYDSLAADNARAWARRWETDIVLDGDPALQRVVRSMLFYLLCSADSGTAMGIPPMGLSSGGYYGHIFWDSDTWMFPSLVLTHPDVARSMVAFRRPHAARRGGERAGERLPRRAVSVGGRRARRRDHAALRRAERAAPRST